MENTPAEYPDILEILKLAREMGASDLHLSSGHPPAARLQGVLTPMNLPPLTPEITRDLSLSMLTETQRAKLESDLDLDFAVEIESSGRLRGNIHFNRGIVEAAFRFIEPMVPSLEKLGHHPTVTHL